MNDNERVEFLAIPETMAALREAMTLTGDNQADTLNRAVQLYAHIERVMCDGVQVQLYRKVERPWWQRLLGWPRWHAEKLEYQ